MLRFQKCSPARLPSLFLFPVYWVSLPPWHQRQWVGLSFFVKISLLIVLFLWMCYMFYWLQIFYFSEEKICLDLCYNSIWTGGSFCSSFLLLCKRFSFLTMRLVEQLDLSLDYSLKVYPVFLVIYSSMYRLFFLFSSQRWSGLEAQCPEPPFFMRFQEGGECGLRRQIKDLVLKRFHSQINHNKLRWTLTLYET